MAFFLRPCSSLPIKTLIACLSLIYGLLIHPNQTVAQIITTIAGLPNQGDGGPAVQANLGSPYGVAVDSQGNIFIADRYNHRIRKVTPNGIISTVVGTGTQGFTGDGGPAVQANLSSPNGVAVDTQGNLFIADFGNNRIRKVTANGTISTVAGTGTQGFTGDGGPATTASLRHPRGVAVDTQGNLFIADLDNQRIRKVSSGGIITTVAGNGTYGSGGDGGPATSAGIGSPYGVAVDKQGNLFIADGSNNRIRKVSPTGIITTVAGNGTYGFSGDGGPATSAQLSSPSSVAVDAQGNLFIADASNYRIRKVATNGLIYTVAGNGPIGDGGDGGPATSAQLNLPTGVAVDSQGNLIIADMGNRRIRKVSANGIINTIAGNGTENYGGDGGPATEARFHFPTDVAVDAQGNLFIVDQFNSRIRKVAPNGIITTVAGNGTSGFSGDGGPATSAQLGYPTGIAVDTHGNLFIAEQGSRRIRKVAPNGIITTVAGNGAQCDDSNICFSGDGGPAIHASLSSPYDVAVDAQGNLFIADHHNGRIRKVTANGMISTVAGNGETGYSGDGGPATNAQIGFPVSITVDGQGNLFFTNPTSQRIRKVTPSGIITTVAGNGVYNFSGDGGPATSASFRNPHDVKVDAQGNLFIVDQDNQRIRKVSPSGIISTIAGNGSAGFSGDGGAATGAQLNNPIAVTMDAQGNLFIADYSNNRIRKVTGLSTTQSLASFSLINADTEQEIKVLAPGDQLNLATLPTRNLNIRANTAPSQVGSVVLMLGGQQIRNQTETGAPYSLFGDTDGNYKSWTPAVGNYTLKGIPYTEAAGKGSAGTPLTLNFTVIDQAPTNQQAVVSFSLMNADTEQPIKLLTPGETLNLATLPTRNLNIRVNTNPAAVGSVVMALSGKQNRTQTETGAPYALFGDNAGNYKSWTPAVGNYTLKATPYTEAAGKGTAGTTLTITFNVVDQAPAARLSAEENPETAGIRFKAYPNPFTETLTLQVRGPKPDQLPVIIYDASGRIVEQLADVPLEQDIQLGSQFAPGLYLLQIGQGKMAKRQKVIKTH
ncbi:putative secreted protein (Por secretion system target) [Larkinella arboricola]|uniref:Putative secreted protein (Por secretion system target) n=1 Tax=Larkinella arboricola TaxID=643671 RepID=A0A327WTQ7_LARAB|nr:T9SS type A sorting domain-containing protein [Larkinella arboricola]RAJ96008.1 putative secreted protein (Por secretion system target) [Larkinella arboricola]